MEIAAVVAVNGEKTEIEGFTITLSVEEFQQVDRGLAFIDARKVKAEGPAFTLYGMMGKVLADLGIENLGFRQRINEPCEDCGELHNSESDYQKLVKSAGELGDEEYHRSVFALDENREVVGDVTEDIFGGDGQADGSDELPDYPSFGSEDFSDTLDKMFGSLGLEKDQYGATKGCDCPPCVAQRAMMKGKLN